jgi:YetA-like protein
MRAQRFGFCTFVLASFFFVGSALADSLDVGVEIVVNDELAVDRDSELVTISFPCAESAAIHSTANLRVLNAAGAEVVAQWQVLTRWRGKPADASKPIRFALVHLRVSLRSGESAQFRVIRRKPTDPAAPQPALGLIVSPIAGAIAIDTRAARFEIPTTSWTLFRRVQIDLDGDLAYGSTAAENVVVPSGSFGAALVDPLGGVYFGATDPQVKVVIEESGPLRAVIRVEGAHQPVGAGTIGRDYLRFTTRYYFSARSPAVRVEHTLENSYLDDPLGAIGVGRYLLHTRLDPFGTVNVRFGGDDGQPIPQSFALGPTAPFEVAFHQDSQGGTNWNQPGTTFNGWRLHATPPTSVLPTTYPSTSPLATGSRGAGWIDATSGPRGLFVSLRYPWQNYPYSFRALYEGSLVLDLLPAEFQGPLWLDDAQKKTWDLLFVPHGAAFDPALASAKHQQPIRVAPPSAYVRETMAWGDLGTLRDPQLSLGVMIDRGEKELATFYKALDSKGSFGWSNFGEYPWAKSTHATGSARNRLTWFDRFMTCGGDAWFERAEIFALHSMALRTYHIKGFVAEEHPNAILSEGIPAWPGTDMLGRDQIPASLAPYKQGIPVGGSGWNGYDGEHMMVDDLYEYYLLTGSRDALTALQRTGEGMLTWKHSIDLYKPIPSSRFIGWVLRASIKIYQATGDSRQLALVQKIVTIADKFRGKSPSPDTGLVYHYLARSIYGMGSHNMVDDYDCPWQIGVGLYGFALYYRETLDPLAVVIAQDLGKYILEYGSNGLFPVEAIECDDHNVVNPKPTNDGVNMWLSSALTISWLAGAGPGVGILAEKIFDDNATHFLNAGDNYHWFHTTGVAFNKDS